MSSECRTPMAALSRAAIPPSPRSSRSRAGRRRSGPVRRRRQQSVRAGGSAPTVVGPERRVYQAGQRAIKSWPKGGSLPHPQRSTWRHPHFRPHTVRVEKNTSGPPAASTSHEPTSSRQRPARFVNIVHASPQLRGSSSINHEPRIPRRR